MMMGCATLTEKIDFQWDCLELAQKTFLFKSALYQQFVKIRTSKLIESTMKNSQQNDEDRFKFAREMLAGPYVGEAKSALEFAVAFFGPLEDSAKVKYLLQNPGHFDLLRQWNPQHAMLSLKPFTVKSGELQGMAAEDFRNASALLCSHPDIIQLVAHPVAKAILKDWWNCAKILPDSSEAKTLSENLFLEASALKLQVPIAESSLPDADWTEKNKDIKSKTVVFPHGNVPA